MDHASTERLRERSIAKRSAWNSIMACPRNDLKHAMIPWSARPAQGRMQIQYYCVCVCVLPSNTSPCLGASKHLLCPIFYGHPQEIMINPWRSTGFGSTGLGCPSANPLRDRPGRQRANPSPQASKCMMKILDTSQNWVPKDRSLNI